MRRRDFLSGAVGLGAVTSSAALFSAVTPSAQNADTFVEVFIDEPIGTISRNIYGHFTEHIGGVIYDGVWVGENSKIPNVNGIRKSLIDGLRRIKAPVIRWPGGCFATTHPNKLLGSGSGRKAPP